MCCQTAAPQLVLSAANARRHHKAKLVLAFRSADAVSIQKKWGKSRGNEGCFVVSGDSEGGDASQGDDVYCIDADAFATTYTRVGGASVLCAAVADYLPASH